jgi:hypothetical protein
MSDGADAGIVGADVARVPAEVMSVTFGAAATVFEFEFVFDGLSAGGVGRTVAGDSVAWG